MKYSSLISKSNWDHSSEICGCSNQRVRWNIFDKTIFGISAVLYCKQEKSTEDGPGKFKYVVHYF